MGSEARLDSSPDEALPRRSVRCPSCNAPSSVIRRWSQSSNVWRASCSRCRHVWQERSARNLIDELLDRRDMAAFAVMIFAAVIGLATLGLVAAILFSAAVDIAGFRNVAVLATFAVGCLVAMFLIARQKL